MPVPSLMTNKSISKGDRSLALENLNNSMGLNLSLNNSLALMLRQSTERGIPITRNMLSNSEDPFQL